MTTHPTPPSPLKVAVIVPAKKINCLGSFLWVQRYGPLQVAGLAREAGYDVKLFNEEIGCAICPQTIASTYDVVGLSAKTCAISRAEEIVRSIELAATRINRKITFVLGGEHASMSNGGRISKRFDFVLPGESEAAFVHLLDSMRPGSETEAPQQDRCPENGFFQCKTFDNVPDVHLVEGYEKTVSSWLFRYLPGLWSIKNRQIPYASFQGSRGCPYNCSFCPTPKYLQGQHYRRRSVASAVTYLRMQVAEHGIRRVIFEDPTSAIPFDERAHRFFGAIARSRIPIRATVLVRSDLCEDTKLLATMKSAGVANLSIGVESMSESTRRAFKKKTSSAMLSRSMEVFHRFGFSVTGLFIVGYDTEGLECFDRIRQFIEQTGIAKWRVSPLCQTPEVSGQFLPPHRIFLWNELERFGHDSADFMNGEYVFFFPRNIRPSDLQRGIWKFNQGLSSWRSLVRLYTRHKRMRPLALRLGNNMAQRWVQREVFASNYIKMLEIVEAPFYRRRGRGWIIDEAFLEARYREKEKAVANTLRNQLFPMFDRRLDGTLGKKTFEETFN